MSTAYMVTTGEYSDYSVVAVFTTREAAERLVAFYPPNHASIEEKPLDEPPGYPADKLPYRVQFDIEGNCDVRQVEPFAENDATCTPTGDGVTMVTYCWACDPNHAAKIANERRAKLIAMGQWNADWASYFAAARAEERAMKFGGARA